MAIQNVFASMGQLDASGVEDKSFGKKEPRFFQRGVYDDVEIMSAKEAYNSDDSKLYQGFAYLHEDKFGDSSWYKLGLVLKQGDKKILSTTLIPTKSLTYTSNGKDVPYKYYALKDFFAAIGYELTRENASELVKNLMNDVTVLKGLKVKITVGYTGIHSEFDKESKKFVLVNKKDEAITDVKFETREAAEAYCKQKNLKIQNFPEVLRIEKSVGSGKAIFTPKKETKKTIKLDF